MMITRVLYWHPAGLKLCYTNGMLEVANLNPEVKTAWVMSRWEMFRLAIQCLRVAIKPPKRTR